MNGTIINILKILHNVFGTIKYANGNCLKTTEKVAGFDYHGWKMLEQYVLRVFKVENE